MSAELNQALLIVAIISIACVILSPIFWWILPDRSQSA